jgi:hypothetical protein
MAEREKYLPAVLLGQRGGRVRSEAQQAASLRNVKKATAARRAMVKRKATR